MPSPKDNMSIFDRIAAGVGKLFASKTNVESNVLIELFGPDGQRKDVREIHNTVTTAGKAGAADQVLAAPTLPKPGWMAVGTGSPAATLLGTEIDRNALTTKT